MDNKSDCNKEFTSQNDISSCESSQGLLPLALKQLRLDPECVKNVYLIGSRLWQTQHPKSDYDLVVVLSSSKSSFFQNNNKIKNFGKKEGKHQTKKASNIPPKLNEFHQVLHAGNFDALIYDENLFIKRIEEFSFLEMITQWLPSSHVWKETLNPRNYFVLNESNVFKFQEKIQESLERDWRIAQKHIEKGDLEKGKRVLAYALRTLVLCIQILQHQCVRDFTSGNYYWTMLQGVYDTQWQAYVDLCGPHWKQLLLDFITLCHNMSKNKNQHMMN